MIHRSEFGAALLTPKQVATILQVSLKTVMRRITEGAIVAHRVGGQWRVSSEEVESYLIHTRNTQRF